MGNLIDLKNNNHVIISLKRIQTANINECPGKRYARLDLNGHP
jgi:hypothetical protein